jgi:hypothetical protein
MARKCDFKKNNMVSEVKIIPGYEDYECDIFGNVYSLKRGKRRKLKPATCKWGYLYLTLSKNGKPKKFKIHRLIMLTFHGASELHVNHIDGVKTNNNFLNLEYCTRSENLLHAFRTGLACNKGENNSQSKLNKQQVIEIKTALLNPYFGINADLARKYNVEPCAIYKIKKGKSWKHVTID